MYNVILKKYNDIVNLYHVNALLNWDQSTFMPKNGVNARAEVVETVTKIGHELFTSDQYYDILCKFHQSIDFDSLTDYQQEEILKLKKNVEKKRKIPVELAGELAKVTSLSMSAWEDAKKNNDDTKYLPFLEKIYALKREVAQLYGYEDNPYDALLDEYDEGLTYSVVQPLFEKLEKELVSIIDDIDKSGKKINDDFLFKDYDVDKQFSFGLDVLKDFGIDFNCFRQDASVHPFTTTIGINDVRTTTDVVVNNFKKGFFSTVHEGGHALYEIDTYKRLQKSPFAMLESLSLHESQSRFYENIICRSRGFWEKYYPKLKALFPENLNGIDVDEFYKAVNKVMISPIRVEADEVTYNLHVLIRAHLENDLINNNLSISSINDSWNEKTKQILGFYPESKSEGYLQDVHWSDGLIGYFSTYTMGNIIAAQWYSKLEEELGSFDDLTVDTFATILKWFNENVYQSGNRYTSTELVKMASGNDLNADYFIQYISRKCKNIYS